MSYASPPSSSRSRASAPSSTCSSDDAVGAPGSRRAGARARGRRRRGARAWPSLARARRPPRRAGSSARAEREGPVGVVAQPRAEGLGRSRRSRRAGSSPRRGRTPPDTPDRSPRAARCARAATTRSRRAPPRRWRRTRSRPALPRRAASRASRSALGRGAVGEIEGVEGALLVEGGSQLGPPFEPEERVPHLLEHGAQRVVVAGRRVALAPALGVRDARTRRPAPSAPPTAPPVASKRCISSRKPSSCTARRSSSGSGPCGRADRPPTRAALDGLGERARRASRARGPGCGFASSVWNSRSAEPERAHRARQRLAAAPARRGRDRRRRGAPARAVGDGQGHRLGSAAPGQEEHAEDETRPRAARAPADIASRSSRRRLQIVHRESDGIIHSVGKETHRGSSYAAISAPSSMSPVEFVAKGSAERIAGRARDISLGGMFIETATPLPFGGRDDRVTSRFRDRRPPSRCPASCAGRATARDGRPVRAHRSPRDARHHGADEGT